MANRYWIGDSGLWSDTAHWSTTSGGSGGASVPAYTEDPTYFELYGTDDVIFDANSFTTTGQTVTIGGAALANNLSTAGVLYSPSFVWSNSTSRLRVFGNIDITGTVWPSGAGGNRVELNGYGSHSITTGGAQPKNIRFFNWGGTATYTMADDLSMTSNSTLAFIIGNALTLNLGGNSITTTAVTFPGDVPLTLSTGTINVTGTLAVSSVDLTCYDIVWNVSGDIIGPGDTTGIFAGSSTSHRLTMTNNSGSTVTLSGITMTNTTLNGSSPFKMVEVVDGGGNDWGGGGGGGGTPPRQYHVKLPPDHIALP